MTGDVATSNERVNLTEKLVYRMVVVAPQAHVLVSCQPLARRTESSCKADIVSLSFEIGT